MRGHDGHPENERCDALASHAAGGEIKSELPAVPTRMDELPYDLRGPSQNKYGGQRNVKLRTYGGKFGAASPGRTLSPDEVEEWRRKNLSGQ